MGQLSAGISHEIRNPLTAISGYVQFYFMKFPPGSPFYDRMQKIEDALEQINGIVEGLLDLARKGEGRMEVCHVQAILEATLKISEVSLRRQGKVEIRKDFAEEVPEIVGDRRQLQQVFLNMMVNASQAMADGGVLTVRTRKGPPDASGEPMAEVVFEDNGCGIPPEIQATIFHAFVTRGKKGGTGLGLSISKNIVDLHGGTIELESQVGRGTRFIIRLPKDGRSARSEPRDASLPETPSTPTLTGLTGFDDSAPTFSVSEVLQGQKPGEGSPGGGGPAGSGGESSGSGGEP
jgi:signal transduction histidine kinase